ncbi:hypothetical protein Z517_09759 [Fonsecaea pedrosoi CBS 271.37]|uniref:C2H2-type domain-containing protein n=1 Tax=Fonsecaea pedrosoi CBS 271.37 TaxID=1442368 RepID=A0A0D2G9C0_9EURO|nr:uncharacterized protein Z517_09759 [Fonsecaea pedrosoi CBS 271.37]KIW77313.1 hypothetical protein Z517_09759 [Fonsecaea pedrosoi CBS 271.37]
MAYFPSESRPDHMVLDENDGDEALTDSRFAAGSPEISFYSDAHNLRVWSSNGNDAHMVLRTSSNKLRLTPSRKRTVDEKKRLSSVAQFNSTLAPAIKLLPDVIATKLATKRPSQSKVRPSSYHDDNEPNDPVHVDEQGHHRLWATSQGAYFEDPLHHINENFKMNSEANDGNDAQVVRGENQDATRQQTCQLSPIVIVDNLLSTFNSDFSSERSRKAIRRDSVRDLSSRSRTHMRLPTYIFKDYPLMQALQVNSPQRDRREVVIELVYRVLSCHNLRRLLSWPKNDQNMDRISSPIPTAQFQHCTSPWRRRSPTPLSRVEDAWERELQQSLNLHVMQSNESARPIGNTITSTHGDRSPKDISTSSTSEGRTLTASSAQSTSSKRPHRRSARGNSNREDSDNPSDDDEEDQPPKKARTSSERSPPTKKLLACPYWKYDPARYSPANTSEKRYRGCSSVYLRDIARLKQHLYRVHKMPDYHCQRCLEVFENEPSLQEHVRAPAELACTYQQNTSSELLSEWQCAQLRKRWTGKTTEEAWKCIWSIIFPRLEPPSSIHAEDRSASIQPSQMPGFLSEFQRRAPSILHEILLERSSQTESAEVTSWLQSAGAQSIFSASIQELFTRLQ